jgi:hypothetical protein
MRFVGVPWTWPPLAVQPLMTLEVLYLRVRANRVKIASVAASAFVGTILVGVLAALTPLLVAALLRIPVLNPAKDFIVQLGAEIAIGGIVGLSYAMADVVAPPTRPKTVMVLRPLAIMAGFALANAFILKAQKPDAFLTLALFIGAIMGIGFALANEWVLHRFRPDEVKRIALSAVGLALSTGLATLLTIVLTAAFAPGPSVITPFPTWRLDASLPLRFAGGINPSIFLEEVFRNVQDGILQLLYIMLNAVIGGIIGIGLAGGLVVGDHLADQLERARYV